MRPRKQPSVAPAERPSQKMLGSAIDLPVPTHYHSRHQSKPAPIMSLTIATREVSHVTILDIQGRIILGPEIGELRNAVRDLVAQGKKKIILNLAHVDYLDSSGVGELVACFTSFIPMQEIGITAPTATFRCTHA